MAPGMVVMVARQSDLWWTMTGAGRVGPSARSHLRLARLSDVVKVLCIDLVTNERIHLGYEMASLALILPVLLGPVPKRVSESGLFRHGSGRAFDLEVHSVMTHWL
jgi:hypothetical protein